MSKERKIESHPSYGQAGFSRRYGSTGRMYGSPLLDHHTTICLTIHRSEVEHGLGQDWRHATEQLIEVEFSAAQFADLLTNMNVGEGVACTIGWVKGEGRMPPPPPEAKVEHEKVVDYFKDRLAATTDKLRAKLAKLDEVLNKKTMSKADKEEIRWAIAGALQDVESNAPFALKQFGEATQKVVVAAQAEVAASTMAIVQKLGFEKIDDMKQALGAAPVERRSHFEYLDKPKEGE